MLFRNPFNSNPFFYNNDDFFEDDIDDNIHSLTERNASLMNYRNSNISRMNQEKENMEDFFSFRNKLQELDNEVKESILELSNIHKQCENERKIQVGKYVTDLVDILMKKKNEELKKENYIKQLELQIKNEKEKNKKLMETKNIMKRTKQAEILRKMENENKIKLLKYKKEKEIEKEEKQKQLELKQKYIENEEEIELNELKNKSEIADKLLFLFQNKCI
jgi:hypothetical protein